MAKRMTSHDAISALFEQLDQTFTSSLDIDDEITNDEQIGNT